MRVFVAGATGAIGTRLVPLLLANDHEVVAMTRSSAKADGLRAAGAEPVVVADPLDRAQVVAALEAARPEVVVHQLTALAALGNLRNFDAAFAQTNRLRAEGTDNLLAGARAAGARRFVAQSFAGWPFARTGGAVKTEEDPLDPTPPASARETLAAIRHLEGAVAGAEGIEGLVLRYGVAAENIAWGAVFALQPISGVYYPVRVLPAALQPVAAAIPSSHVFEGMRALLVSHTFRSDLLLYAGLLDLLYLAAGVAGFLCFFKIARVRGLLLHVGE